MDYLSSSSVDAVRWYWLVDKLHQAAERGESFHISSDRTSIVVCDSVKAFVNHYITAYDGATYIVFGRSGSGKTMAALHLIHGEYDDRPKRAIMINAGGDPNFMESFASQQNAPDAAPFLEMILCAALVNAQKKSSQGIAARTWNFSRTHVACSIIAAVLLQLPLSPFPCRAQSHSRAALADQRRYALIFLFSSLMTIQNQKRTKLFYRDYTPKLRPQILLFSF
jgi:hypothetical protein